MTRVIVGTPPAPLPGQRLSEDDRLWAQSVGDDVEAEAPVMQTRLDRWLTALAERARMCGHGSDLNWSIRVANALFVNCPCCLVWRGLFLGAIVGGSVGAVIGYGIGRL